MCIVNSLFDELSSWLINLLLAGAIVSTTDVKIYFEKSYVEGMNCILLVYHVLILYVLVYS